MVRLIFIATLFICLNTQGQKKWHTTANAHSHNDYEQAFPFWNAWKQGFGSIEVDVFLHNGKLIVAHEKSQLNRGWTIDSLYLQPLLHCINTNKGFVYADTTRTLQLLVDIKTDAAATLAKLVEKINTYPELTATSSLQIVITGNKPVASDFSSWPVWLKFDGNLQTNYNTAELNRIGLFSDNFAKYSGWNGKGRLPEKELQTIKQLISKAHQLNKKIRFWNAPDIINSWYSFIDFEIDFINTDHIEGISTFLKQLPDRVFTSTATHETYAPKWRNDGLDKPVRNIILLIGDGTGLVQWYAGYTANKAKLNVFNMHYTGFSKTSSSDNYITDSAPGATAFSSGSKTNNRAVGVDNTGARLTLLPEIIRQRKMKTGIISSGDLRDATPAAFYAHQSERSNYPAILKDMVNAPVDIIMGACDFNKQDSIKTELARNFSIFSSIENITNNNKALLVADPKAALSITCGRGNWAENAFEKAVSLLSQNKEGFLLVLEGAQIDHGGHANKLPYVVTELLDFDKVIGKAMQFADGNGETLVIVTGDHETGGLTLTGGDYISGSVKGQFSTEDHTAIPVPVFAYGPQSNIFSGVYENTLIFYKILQALKLKTEKK